MIHLLPMSAVHRSVTARPRDRPRRAPAHLSAADGAAALRVSELHCPTDSRAPAGGHFYTRNAHLYALLLSLTTRRLTRPATMNNVADFAAATGPSHVESTDRPAAAPAAHQRSCGAVGALQRPQCGRYARQLLDVIESAGYPLSRTAPTFWLPFGGVRTVFLQSVHPGQGQSEPDDLLSAICPCTVGNSWIYRDAAGPHGFQKNGPCRGKIPALGCYFSNCRAMTTR